MTSKRTRAISKRVSFCLPRFIIFTYLAFIFGSSVLRAQGTVLNSMVTRVIVDSLVSQLNRYYVSKEAAVKISMHLRKRYEEGIYNRVQDPDELAGLITSDVYSIHRDEHFHVEYNPALASEVAGEIDDVPGMVARKLEEEKAKNYGFKKTEILNGNIGYLEISSFSRLNRYSKATADAALKMLSGTRAIIIDLRYGRGGSPDMVNYIASHFFKTKTHIADIYIRSENTSLPYWTVPDSSYGALTSVPVFILTSYKTFSAAEGLAYSLQNQKRAVIVGETTRGGAHTVTYKPLSSGFVCDIPFGSVTDPVTKRNWEGKGVAPDIATSQDKALETAELKIFGAAMAVAKDSLTLNNLLWQLKLLQSANHPFTADSTVLKSYTGVYGANKITFENGLLYFQKTGMAKFSLLAISNTLLRPLGNEAFMVEFGTSAAGNPQLVVHNEDGRNEKAEKSKGL